MNGNIVLGRVAMVLMAAVMAACTAPRSGAGGPVTGSGAPPILEHGGDGRDASGEAAPAWPGLGNVLPAGGGAGGAGSGAGGAGGAGGASMQCVHGVCETGKGLDPACDPCVTDICAANATCCEEAWDETCVQYARWFCGACGAEGCSDLPPEGACVGDYVLTCEDGGIERANCWAAAEQGRCQWSEAEGSYTCVPF